MALLDKLVAPDSSASVAGARVTLDVGAASDAQVLGSLAQLFGADDERTEVGLLRDGEALGVVSRDAAAGALADGMKAGLGSADGMQLPGVANFDISRWVCPLPGCGYSVMAIALGRGSRCARHPDTDLIEAA